MKRKISLISAREERGSALVEFAVTVPLITFLLLAILEGFFAMYIYHYTEYAAQQGARFAVVRGNTISGACNTSAPPNFTIVYDCMASTGDIQNYVQSLGAINSAGLTINQTSTYVWPGLNPDNTTTNCTGAQSNSKGCMVKVTASYTFNFIPLLPFTAMTMSATSEKVILQ